MFLHPLFQVASRTYVDAPEKWVQAWKIRLIQEKPPGVDHCDAQWIPVFAGMTGSVLRE